MTKGNVQDLLLKHFILVWCPLAHPSSSSVWIHSSFSLGKAILKFSVQPIVLTFQKNFDWEKIAEKLWNVISVKSRDLFSQWQVKILVWTVEIFIETGRHFYDDTSRLYYVQSRFSWWRGRDFIKIDRDIHDDKLRLIIKVRDFHDNRSRFS